LGIYDRDYYPRAPQRPDLSAFAPRTVVGALIAVNVAVWLVDAFTPENVVTFAGQRIVLGHWLSEHMAAHASTITKPWLWWQFLTAGFAHASGYEHILGNMLVLFFLGRDVEYRYGSKEFLRIYLATLVIANIAWSAASWIVGTHGIDTSVLGASGAIAGVVVLYALNFPHRTLLLFFVIPMPAWLLGALVVAYDVYGAMGGVQGSNVAYSVHVAGAAFAFAYYWQNWNLSRWTFGLHWPRPPRGSKPRLHVHNPDEGPKPDLAREVDRILDKIYREGEASLTAEERRTLETASREYQRKRDG